MVLVCPNCGAQIRLWEKVCSRCGAARPNDNEAYTPSPEAVKRTKEHHAGPVHIPSATHAPDYISPHKAQGKGRDGHPPTSAHAKTDDHAQMPPLELEVKHKNGCHHCKGTGVVDGMLPSDSEDPDAQRCNCLQGKCMYCKGEGACSQCKGFGIVAHGDCTQCGGTGKCAFCGGGGQCPICHGSGFARAAWVACPRCDGTGEKYPKHWRRGPEPDRSDDEEEE